MFIARLGKVWLDNVILYSLAPPPLTPLGGSFSSGTKYNHLKLILLQMPVRFRKDLVPAAVVAPPLIG